MDDTAQSPQQPVTPTDQQGQPSPVQQQGVSQPHAPSDVLQDPVPQQPVSVPAGGKEQEGVPIGVQPTHPEVTIPQEVQEAGIEATPSEEPQLTEEHAGLVEVAKEATPVPTAPTIVQLPDTYKAPKGFFVLLHQQVKNAATWLYLLLFKAEEQKSLQQAQEQKEKKT